MAHQSLIAFRYRLHEELGSGGMGAVYRVYDQLNATYVALKRVNIPTELLDFMSLGSIGSSSGLWVALAEEFKILASLRHPNIISVLDYGFDSTRQPYYTMELLSTPQNLLDYGRDKPLVEKINLLVKVLEALSYLHRRGIIHRDLKPDNALVVNGQVKVLDFGLAVARNKLGDNTPVGTLHYISPEVLNGKPISQSADLYAVGVMAYQLLTGLYPFNLNQSLTELALTIIEQPVNFDDLDLNPALKVVLSKLLAKTPNERYASATEAIEAFYYAIGQEPPVETTTSRDSFIQAAEFVGRQEELKTLINALDNAINRQGSAWLVGGESGVGKSRLLDELRTQALVEGVLVLRGQAVEGGGLPYQVWREPLRRLVLSVDLTNLEAGILKPIVPDISTLLGRDIADVPELPGDAGTARLAGVILSLFERQTETVVLLLEDLQWAQSSLFVLRHLLTHIAQLPLLVIGNYRNDEAPYLPSQLIGMQSIILPRLSTEEIIQLSVEMLGEGGKDPVIVERLSKETEGNTFFMVEIVRALAEVAGRLDKVGSMTLPHSIMAGSIHRILQRRIERVAAWGQPLLTLAAVIGRQIKRPLLETLLASDATLLETHDLDTWLNICIEASVFDIQDENWRFAHDKLREFLLNKLDGIERALMNGMVAKAIETTYPNDSAYHELLYNHWREAGNVEREIHYMLLVVKQMVQIRATHTEAEQLIQRGLTLLNENDVQYITLLNWRAESHRLRSLHEPAKEYAQAALALAEQLGVKGEMATSLNSLGMIDWIQGKYATATDYFQRSLELYHKINDKAGIAKNLNSLGIIASSRGDYASSEDYFQQSLAHYREIDDKVGIGMSLNGLGVVAKNRGDYTVAENYLQENLTLRREIGDKAGIAIALNNLGIVNSSTGDYTASIRFHQESLALRHEIGDKSGIAHSLNNLGGIAWRQGDYAIAEGYYKESLALRREIGEKAGVANCLNNLALVASGLNNHVEAYNYHQECLALRHEIGNKAGVAITLNGLGTTARYLGDYTASYSYQNQSLALRREIGDKEGIAISLADLSVLAFEQGDSDLLGYLREGFSIALEIRSLAHIGALLTTLSRWLFSQGQITEAARLAGLIEKHPVIHNEIKQQFLSQLLKALEAQLPADKLNMLMDEGATFDLEAVAREQLQNLEKP